MTRGIVPLLALLLVFTLSGCAAVDNLLNKGPKPEDTGIKLEKAVKAGNTKSFCRLLTPNYKNTFRYKNTTKTYKCSLKSINNTILKSWTTDKLFHTTLSVKGEYQTKIKMDFGVGEVADKAYLLTLTKSASVENAPWRVSNIQTLDGVQFGVG